MTGCYTCGGGMGKHDPVAHDQVPENDEPCMCGTDFTCMAEDHDHAVADLSGWWYLRPGESMDEHAARLNSDPRWKQ